MAPAWRVGCKSGQKVPGPPGTFYVPRHPTVRTRVKAAIGKGRLTQDEGKALLDLVTPTADYKALADADLVIEAVFEDRDVKKAVIEAVEAAREREGA